eukprot:365052-Chlamydomonas_euryale.AAC.28
MIAWNFSLPLQLQMNHTASSQQALLEQNTHSSRLTPSAQGGVGAKAHPVKLHKLLHGVLAGP